MPTGSTAGSDAEFGYLAGIGAITIEVIYTFVSLAAIVWFRRQLKSEYSIVKHLVVPIIAIVGAGAALFGSLQPAPDPLLQTMPYVALTWIILGLAYIAVLRFTKPGLVEQIGRDLSTLDVAEPVDMRFNLDPNAPLE